MRNTGGSAKIKTLILMRFGIIAIILFVVAGVFFGIASKTAKARETVSRYTEDRMILQKAVADHFQWAAKLNSAINYGVEFTGSTDPTACNFGKTFYSSRIQNSEDWADFRSKIEPLHNSIHQNAGEILSLDNKEKSQKIYLENVRPTLDELVTVLNEYITIYDEKVEKAEAGEQEIIKIQQIVIAVQVLVLFVILVNLYFFIRKEIIRPLVRIGEQSKRLAHGDLQLDFEVDCRNADIQELCEALRESIAEIKKYVDDIARAMGEMSNRNFNVSPSQPFVGDFKPIEDSIGKMIMSVTAALSQMDLAADQVASGSDMVSSTAQDLSEGTVRQASSVEELAATVTEISERVSQNAANADKASEQASRATEAISANNDQMRLLMNSMYEIDEKSKEIGKIIKTIEDIAFQTNILALNAAIEAARAGTAGKGFAVVADEVRNLAGKTSEAAKNTTALIQGSIGAIGSGVELAQKAADDLLGVVEGANETTRAILEITKATNEQANSILQIKTGLDEISMVVQTNAAATEENAATSEELTSQANLVKDLIESFELFQAPDDSAEQ